MITINKLPNGLYQILDNDGCFTDCQTQKSTTGVILMNIIEASDVYTIARHVISAYCEILTHFSGKSITFSYNGIICPIYFHDSALEVYERYKQLSSSK